MPNPQDFTIEAVRANGNKRGYRFVVSGPGQRNYPKPIKAKDRLYYFDGEALTFDECIENLVFLLENKVQPTSRDEYAQKVIERMGEYRLKLWELMR